jgi:hypothetical protein
MRKQLPYAGAAMACLATLWLAGCHGPVGPSLDNVTFQNVALQPTAQNSALCCCHVVGSVTNGNSVGVHVTVKFVAYDGQRSDPLSSLIHFLPDLRSGETRTIDAPSFLLPCDLIKDLKKEVEVKGLTSPGR